MGAPREHGARDVPGDAHEDIVACARLGEFRYKRVAVVVPPPHPIRACARGCHRYITVSMHRLLLGLFAALSLSAADVNTFSIVAYDPATGDCGVTVASRYFSVGAVVPWAEAGTGCIATQANVKVGYGPRGLELLRQGLAARQVIDKLLADDNLSRQGWPPGGRHRPSR